MARGDGLKNYENLDLKDARNDNRLTEVYRDWAKKYDYDNDHVLGTVSQPKSVNLLSHWLQVKTASSRCHVTLPNASTFNLISSANQ